MKNLFLFLITLFLIYSCSKEEENNDNPNDVIQISTLQVTNITSESSKFSASMVGSNSNYQTGFCWGTTSTPTINSDNYILVGNATSNNFSSQVNNLTPNSSYYVRAFATNFSNTIYGNAVSFNTLNPISTLNAKNITTTTAILKGHIDQIGSANNEVGFVCSTSPNPTINNVVNSTVIIGTADFELLVNNLNYNTVYYYRSYLNKNGNYSYGEQKQFKTTGYFGPAGGYVAYDTGLDFYQQNGWRYLEVNPQPLPDFPNGNGIEWGSITTSGGSYVNGLSQEFGTGYTNTQIIASNITSTNCAAKYCLNFVKNGYDDWFLASSEEGLIIALSLGNANLAGIVHCWTSSQDSNPYAYIVEYGTVSQPPYITTSPKSSSNLDTFPVRRY